MEIKKILNNERQEEGEAFEQISNLPLSECRAQVDRGSPQFSAVLVQFLHMAWAAVHVVPSLHDGHALNVSIGGGSVLLL